MTANASLAEDERRRVKRRPGPIAIANKSSDEDFVNNYLTAEAGWKQWTHPRTGSVFTLDLVQADALGGVELEACFDMVQLTSGDDYRASSLGWHPAMKRREMRSPHLRYILVRDDDGVIKAFASLMPTFENHEPVVYCYEIHVLPELQGTGLGTRLLGYLQTIAEKVPSVVKVVLTCFKSNSRALGFYDKMGFVVDDFSPGERSLRSGRVVVPDYVILSRRTADGHQEH